MFVVGNEAACPPLFSLDNTVLHAFGIMPEGKYGLTLDEVQVDIDSMSPKIPQAKDDSEAVRQKLCDSLTSALEMVVSKQLVKRVLGVLNDVDAVEVGDLCRHAQLKAQEGLLVDRIIHKRTQIECEVSNGKEPLNVGLDLRGSSEDEAEPKNDGKYACLASLPAADKSEESLVLKSNSESEGGLLVPQETITGLELMEQAKRVACDVELNLYSLNGGVNKKYKEKARSLLFNLKDKSNPELRARVFDGEITPKILVRMSPEQLASKELSQWRTAKAEEFASMVVLTDADLDPRRIVKKTHKGEFQLVAEEIEFSATTRTTSPRPIIPVNVKADAGENGRGYPSPARVGSCGAKLSVSNDGCLKEDRIRGQSKLLSDFQETGENETLPKEGTANNVWRDLHAVDAHNRTITLSKEGTASAVWRDCCTEDAPNRTVPRITEELPNADAAVQDETLADFDLSRTALSRRDKMLRNILGSYPDNYTMKLNKIPSTRCNESGGARSSLSKMSEKGCETAVWEGSIQLSATRFALINGFYESGERLVLKDWPRSVEVKGRVRLVVLDKFLQDLQLSRSRTVTILSLCPSESQGESKQSKAYLKEMADHYRVGGRAGFVEPQPGFELYLLAPSSIEPSSSEDLGNIKATLKREDGVLLGVVVWRKSQPQGALSNKRPDQNGSVKEDALSNMVFQSHTKIDVKSSRCIEIPSSEGWFPASQKTASIPSVVYVSGNSSMQASKRRGDALTRHNPPIGGEWHPTSSLDKKIIESARGAVTKSVCRLHQSVDLEDIPPGFLPRPVKTSFARSATLMADSKTAVQGCQAPLPYTASVPGQASLLPFQSKEISNNCPPGFFHLEGIQCASLKDDDDLPEFNFDVEGVVSQAPSNHLLAADPAHHSSRNTHNFASQSFTRLHPMSDPLNRYHGHRHNVYDLHPPGLEVHPVHGGLPIWHEFQCEDSLALSVTSVPTVGGWSGPERRICSVPTMLRDVSLGVRHLSGYHQRSPHTRAPSKSAFTDESMSMTPMNGTNQRSSKLPAAFKCTGAGEQESSVFDHETKTGLAHTLSVPPVLTSSQLPFPNQAVEKVAERFYPRSEISQQHAASVSSSAAPPVVPQGSGDQPSRSQRELSLVHMVVQHQHSTMENKAFDRRPSGVPFPQQVRCCGQQQGIVTCDPSERQQMGSVQMHSRRVENSERKSAQKDSYVVDEDASVNHRYGTEGLGMRGRNQKSGSILRMQRDQKRRRDVARTLAGGSEMKEEPESVMESRPPKSSRRRERERDQ